MKSFGGKLQGRSSIARIHVIDRGEQRRSARINSGEEIALRLGHRPQVFEEDAALFELYALLIEAARQRVA